MSLATRLQVLLAVGLLATGHPAALVATPALLALLALRALARHRLTPPRVVVGPVGAGYSRVPDLAERTPAWPS
jgi:DNA-binding LacI/PurR family transcriptional regulator